MNKFVLLAVIALTLSVSSFQSARQLKAESCGEITTLYAHDPLQCSLDLHTGNPGLIIQEGELRNRCSHLRMDYSPDVATVRTKDSFKFELFEGNTYKGEAPVEYVVPSLSVGIQGGDTGAIVDLGTLVETASLLGQSVVGNGANAFVGLSADWGRTRLQSRPLTTGAHAPIKVGHVYVARISTAGKPDLIAKILVLEFRPNESVTVRWQKLAG